MQLNYRQWFLISVLLLVNLVIFGLLFLALMGKVYFGE